MGAGFHQLYTPFTRIITYLICDAPQLTAQLKQTVNNENETRVLTQLNRPNLKYTR